PLMPLSLWQMDVDQIAHNWLPPPSEVNPIPWLLAVLVLAAGLPFFVVSTSAPLLQKWFAATTHWSAQDPYYLYAASNLGSMLALLGYPTLVEPNLSLSTQAVLWIAGYGLLLALIACCAASLWRAKGRVGVAPHLPASSHPVTRSPGHPVTLARRLRWPALAFVPSSLMLGLTTYITTDLAAIPLLWVIPLAIYLLSFILVFSRAPALVHRLFVLLLPVLILLVVF